MRVTLSTGFLGVKCMVLKRRGPALNGPEVAVSFGQRIRSPPGAVLVVGQVLTSRMSNSGAPRPICGCRPDGSVLLHSENPAMAVQPRPHDPAGSEVAAACRGCGQEAGLATHAATLQSCRRRSRRSRARLGLSTACSRPAPGCPSSRPEEQPPPSVNEEWHSAEGKPAAYYRRLSLLHGRTAATQQKAAAQLQHSK